MTRKSSNDNAITRESLYGTTAEPTYSGIVSFMRRKYSKDLTGADVAVLGVPFDTATTNRPGARLGPRGIRAASSIIAWEKMYGMEFDPFDKLAVIDWGDCYFDHGRPQGVPDQIEQCAFDIIEQGPGLLTLGGDHFISYPLIKAHIRKFGGPVSILHFDAHSDTWADEDGRIDHGTMFYFAAKEGLVDPSTSVQIGLRTTNPDTMGFNVLDAPWVHANGIDATITQARKILGDTPVYLTFDIRKLELLCRKWELTSLSLSLTSPPSLPPHLPHLPPPSLTSPLPPSPPPSLPPSPPSSPPSLPPSPPFLTSLPPLPPSLP